MNGYHHCNIPAAKIKSVALYPFTPYLTLAHGGGGILATYHFNEGSSGKGNDITDFSELCVMQCIFFRL